MEVEVGEVGGEVEVGVEDGGEGEGDGFCAGGRRLGLFALLAGGFEGDADARAECLLVGAVGPVDEDGRDGEGWFRGERRGAMHHSLPAMGLGLLLRIGCGWDGLELRIYLVVRIWKQMLWNTVGNRVLSQARFRSINVRDVRSEMPRHAYPAAVRIKATIRKAQALCKVILGKVGVFVM